MLKCSLHHKQHLFNIKPLQSKSSIKTHFYLLVGCIFLCVCRKPQDGFTWAEPWAERSNRCGALRDKLVRLEQMLDRGVREGGPVAGANQGWLSTPGKGRSQHNSGEPQGQQLTFGVYSLRRRRKSRESLGFLFLFIYVFIYLVEVY